MTEGDTRAEDRNLARKHLLRRGMLDQEAIVRALCRGH